jgi:hypothetical protein
MNKNKQILNILSIVVFSAILFVACSKARIEGPIDAGPPAGENTTNPLQEQELLYFVPLDSFYLTKQPKAKISKDLYASAGNNWDITDNGTSIHGSSTMFSYPNGNSVEDPIKFKVIELFKIHHFIYYNIQTVSNNILLETNTILNLNFYKDTNILIFNNLDIISISFKNNLSDALGKTLYPFYSNMQNGINNWSKTTTPNNNKFICSMGDEERFFGRIQTVGWFLIGDYAQFNTTEYTNLTFTSSNADLTNVGIYVCFSGINSYTKVENYTSIPLPVGEHAKIVAVGITNENRLYYDYKEIVIDNNETNYDIKMKFTVDELLTQMLDSL